MFEDERGNAKEYDIDTVKEDISSPLKGKNICFLGSSVTKGFGSLDVSFPEFLSKECGITFVKEAKNGTTLVNESEDSYLNRLYCIDKRNHFDCIVVQLSTNDASKGKESGKADDFDDKTICGAINTIISYIEENYHCPILFYTNPYYEMENYKRMVTLLHEIEKNRKIMVLDLFNDQEFNKEINIDRELYMVDDIHPTKAGYRLIAKKVKEMLTLVLRKWM